MLSEAQISSMPIRLLFCLRHRCGAKYILKNHFEKAESILRGLQEVPQVIFSPSPSLQEEISVESWPEEMSQDSSSGFPDWSSDS